MGNAKSRTGGYDTTDTGEDDLLASGAGIATTAAPAFSIPKGLILSHACNECGLMIITQSRDNASETAHYHCSECENYDLCFRCFHERRHEADFPTHELSLDTTRVGVAVAQVTEMDDPEMCINFVCKSFSDRRALGWRNRKGQIQWLKFRQLGVLVQDVARAIAHLTWKQTTPVYQKASIFAENNNNNNNNKSNSGAKVPSSSPPSSSSPPPASEKPVPCGTVPIFVESNRPIIAIAGSNRPWWIVADFATAIAGCVLAPLYSTMSAAVFCKLLEQTEAAFLFVNRSCLSKLDEDPTLLPHLRHVVLLDAEVEFEPDQIRLATRPDIRVWNWCEFVAFGGAASDVAHYKPDIDDLFTIIYTSGSTGLPKGVMHSLRSWSFSLRRLASWMHDPLVELSFAPLGHSSGRRFVWQTFFVDDEAYPENDDKFERILSEAREIGPVIMSSTPLLWNAVYAKFNSALLAYKEQHKEVPANECRAEVLKQFRWIMGHRMKVASIGGGSSSKEVLDFLWDCFSCMVNNGFGTTETGSVMSGGASHVMKFVPTTLWKLRSVPELGYDANGKPPRGELLIATPNTAMGYFKLQAQTEASFVDGFFRTGDIVEVVGPDEVRVIDRAKNFVKLAQGEFVACEQLEATFVSCESVGQICVHADTLRSFVVAVVVPNFAFVKKKLHLPEGTSHESICALPACYDLILADIAKRAVECSLQAFECPRALVLTHVEFTATNGLLTGTLKPNRQGVAKQFERELKAKYDEAENVSISLAPLLQRVLGVEAAALLDGSKTFRELGGNSLKAKQVQDAARQLGVDLPVHQLLGDYTVKQLGEFAEARLASSRAPDFETTSGPVDVEALTKLPDGLKYARRRLDPAAGLTYFLTGATGFLGFKILASLLELGATEVIVLVRARNHEAGVAKLREVAERAQLAIDFSKIRVVLGDCAELLQSMMSASDLQYVLDHADVVVHNAALVNSTFSLQMLVPSNVTSTRELITLCTYEKTPKRFVYVSSAGVLYPFVHMGIDSADTEKRLQAESPFFVTMGGYSASKLLSEMLCYKAADAGLDVRILRPSSVSPDPQTGFFNATDTFCRIIKACMIQKSIPKLDDSCTINLVNVDWCAKAIAVGSTAESFPEIVNVVSSKSTTWRSIFSWVASWDVSIRIVEYADWLRELRRLIESSENLTASKAGNAHPLQELLPRFAVAFPYRGDFYGAPKGVTNEQTEKALKSKTPQPSQIEFKLSFERISNEM